MAENTEVLKFINDINDELKARIRENSAKHIEELLGQSELSRGDLVFLAGVANGSIKSRHQSMIDAGKTEFSASELITAVFDGVRAVGTRKPSVESVKSFLDSLSEEDKAKFIAQITG